jgi:hypothetical protein
MPKASTTSGTVGFDPGGANEWSDGSVIMLGGLLGSMGSQANDINDSGVVVGLSTFAAVPPPIPTPEPSTWAMMLIGFAGLAFAGYRRALRTV